MQELQRNFLDVGGREGTEQNYPATSSRGCRCYSERSAGWLQEGLLLSIDHIATLRIIIEQSIEWNTSLYINFVYFEKTFNSLDRSVL